MYQVYRVGLLALTLLIGFGCEQNRELSPQAIGWDYVPLQRGQYWLYDAHQITYNELSEYREENFESRVVVGDFTLDQAGDTVYYLHRERRNQPEANWSLDSVWQVKRTPYRYQETANNLSRMVLSFPLSTGKQWDVNALNTRDPWIWEVSSMNQTVEANGLRFPAGMLVTERYLDDPVVETDIRYRVYQRGVGEVYRFRDNRQHCFAGEPCNEEVGEKIVDYLELILKESSILPQ